MCIVAIVLSSPHISAVARSLIQLFTLSVDSRAKARPVDRYAQSSRLLFSNSAAEMRRVDPESFSEFAIEARAIASSPTDPEIKGRAISLRMPAAAARGRSRYSIDREQNQRSEIKTSFEI